MGFDLDVYRKKISETKNFLNNQLQAKPQIGIILGTGLGGLVAEMDSIQELHYEEIPNFPISTVESHAGKLLLGKLAGKTILAMQGLY